MENTKALEITRWIEKYVRTNLYLAPTSSWSWSEGYVQDRIQSALDEATTDLRAQLAERDAQLAAERAMLNKLGDDVADIFEQMLMGKWQDELGHDVQLNKAMLYAQNTLGYIVEKRNKATRTPTQTVESE